jgi:autotransporter-associated beta strand protein
VSGGILDLGGASHTAGTVTISGGTIQDGTLTGGSFAGQSGTVSAILAGNAIMTKTTSGTLILGAANTYLGNTVINAGTLALGRAGAINSSPLVSIAAGATFDVSTISSYNFSGGTTLSANGTSSAASIKGGTTVNLGSAPIDLTYDGLHPALTISQGTLVLNGNNFIVNGSPLAGGIAYPIVQQVNGNISSFGSFAVSGTAIGAPGTSATISVVGGAVMLTITDLTTITLSSLSPSVYGQAASFTATVSPSPPGGTVQFYDNGVALGNPVAINAGAASYSTNTLSVGVHPITASYSGTVGYAASSTANSSTQQVTLPPNSIPVTISGTALLANGTVQMNFTGVPGYNYVIEGTTSLSPPISWTSLGTNTADINGVFNFIDLGATNFNGRYYRSAVQ